MAEPDVNELADLIVRIESALMAGEFDVLNRTMRDMAKGTMQPDERVTRLAWLRATFMFRRKMPAWSDLRDRMVMEFNAINKPNVMRGLT